jgi:hypothetical protein
MLILVFLVGLLLLDRIAHKSSILEKIGFALPTGLALTTLLMVLMDWCGVALTRTSLSIVTFCLLAAAAAASILMYRKQRPALKPVSLNLKWTNLLWVVMMGVVVYLEYVNFTKCMAFPTYDRDSMAAFDTIGYVCAREHTFCGMSIFDPSYIPAVKGPGSYISYLPMVQLSYAYVYTFGAATSKAIPAFIYLGFLFGFYGLCRRRISHTGSALVLLGIVTAPEMLSFASLSVTNVMQACIASAGLIYACLWATERKAGDLRLAILLLAVNNWMRAEGVVFVGVAWLIIAISALRRKEWKCALLPALALVPLALWMVYSKACGLTAESAVIAHLFWDGEKAATIAKGAWSLFSADSYYGWTFQIFVLVLLAHLVCFGAYRWAKGKDGSAKDCAAKFGGLANLLVPAAMTACIAGYYLILYHVDYKWDSIDNVLAYSAKRFNFCFVPLAWYYVADSALLNRFFRWLENSIGIGGVVTIGRKKTTGKQKA